MANPVIVYAKSTCPYCLATRKTLEEMGVEFKLVNCDLIENGQDIREELVTLTGQKTVPNIFIGGKHIGGNSDLQDKNKSGVLKTILAEAGVNIA